MSKERLKEIIKERLDQVYIRELFNTPEHIKKTKDWPYIQVKESNYDWLITEVQDLQAYIEEQSKKSVELNVFLQNRKTTSSLGMHVIDAVMKYVQELEMKLGNVMDNHTYIEGWYHDEKRKNKRLHEAIRIVLDGGSLLEAETQTLLKTLEETKNE